MSPKQSGEEHNRFLSFGIDLGTTNSCIAKKEDNEIRVFQTRENTNTTRSAVYYNKMGRKIVGLRAFNEMFSDPENVAIEFKRLMGTTYKKEFPATGISLTPEELSSEVLKSLRNDAERLTEESVVAAVITVPAAFGALQCESTYKAAKLAGIETVHLLQEPIAAAIAFGLKHEANENYWMVFDLGGGTFDVAIVSTHQGRLTVLNNEGNNYLGGKDIDELIVEKILIPNIGEHYDLFDSNSEEYQKIFRKLLFKAEEIKIELSNLKNTVVFIDDVGNDKNGEYINLEFEVSQEDLESIMEKITQETMQLAEKALVGANISKEQLSKILLVGGSTQIPAIRNKLRETFEVKLDYSLDPITVVAKGAAIYASLTKTVQKIEKVIPLDRDSQFVELEYEPITGSLQSSVEGSFHGDFQVCEISVDSTDGFWTSGWFKLQDEINKYFQLEVRLQQNKTNNYIVRARDKKGNNLDVKGAEFSIEHKEEHLSVAKPLIPHSISIEYIDSDGNRKLEPIIYKNTSLPAFGSCTFRASKELRTRQVNNFISIKLWEGEQFDEPEGNMWVANLYVTSHDISRPLSKGSDIEIYLEVNESRRINIFASIPTHNLNISKSEFYKPTPINTEERFIQIKDEIEEFFQRLQYINEKFSYSEELRRKEYNAIYDELEDFSVEYEKELGASIHNNDRLNKFIAKSKSIRIKIAYLERSVLVKKQQHKLQKDAIETMNRVNYTVNYFGGHDEKEEYEKLKGNWHEAVEFQDSRGEQHVKNKMEALERDILTKRYDFWQHLFYDICGKQEKFIDRNEAHKWMAIGEKADKNEELDTLKMAVINLLGLLKKDINQVIEEGFLPPGLMK